MKEISESCNGSLDDLVAEVVDQFMERVRRGEQPRIEDYTGRHPEAAALLRQILPALQVLQPPSEAAGAQAPAEPPGGRSGTLGDFRILREVGRGGMGIVYEAEQISLGRRVALKVLPFAATLDPRQLQRFQNEARAAASLHHEHIVPVFAVGQERGVHFFAMQFIDGRTLADLIASERRAAASPGVDQTTAAPGAAPPAPPAADTEPIAGKTTAPLPRATAYYRQVAGWGIQAAEALEHAHALGIVHRDIKPSNLMIDAHDQLWIADFGLARRAAESDLTMTGDLVGTLRYMSPEQALAKHDLVDHRSDIYSLGATLYELLTLRPAVEGKDRQEIIQHLTQTDATSPRRHERGIPADLETIVLKALAREPDGRYATAKELAEDLRRFLADKPILAKRPTLRQRVRKWERRHVAAVRATVAAVLVSLLGLAATIGRDVRNRATLEQEAAHDLMIRDNKLNGEIIHCVNTMEMQHDIIGNRLADPIKVRALLNGTILWPPYSNLNTSGLMALIARNEDLLEAKLAERLKRVIVERTADIDNLRYAIKLDQIRTPSDYQDFDEFASPYGKQEIASPHGKYDVLFRVLGFDWKTKTPVEIGLEIRQHRLRYVLAGALDDWADKSPPDREQLLETARLADPDPWRDQVRDAKNWLDLQKLEQLAREVDPRTQPPQILAFLARKLVAQKGDASALLRSALIHNPQDFWLHFDLGNSLQNPDQRIGCFQAAVALRSRNVAAHYHLGRALHDKKDLDGAIEYYTKTLVLNPDVGTVVRANLGLALHEKNDLVAAIKHYCIALTRGLSRCFNGATYDMAHELLDLTPREREDLDGSIEQFRKALERGTDDAVAHNKLGFALYYKRDLDDAIQQFRTALGLDESSGITHVKLGIALYYQNDLAGAAHHFQAALILARMLEGNDRQMVAKDRGVSAVLNGDVQPASFQEWLAYIEVCQRKNGHATAFRLWSQALSKHPASAENFRASDLRNPFRFPIGKGLSQPWKAATFAEDFRVGFRFRAARDAVLASSGEGEDALKITHADRMTMRKQAYEWLRADLDNWVKQFQHKQPDAVRALADILPQWVKSPDLAGVRNEQNLAKLPEAERKLWQKLWTDVEQMRKQANGMFKETARLSGMVTDYRRFPQHNVQLNAGATYVIDLESTRFDSCLTVREPDGLGISDNALDTVINLKSRLIATPPADGVYGMSITPVLFKQSADGPDADRNNVGAYTLTIREFVK